MDFSSDNISVGSNFQIKTNTLPYFTSLENYYGIPQN
jgi:hypothetical protein